jgi:hypothetical protein
MALWRMPFAPSLGVRNLSGVISKDPGFDPRHTRWFAEGHKSAGAVYVAPFVTEGNGLASGWARGVTVANATSSSSRAVLLSTTHLAHAFQAATAPFKGRLNEVVFFVDKQGFLIGSSHGHVSHTDVFTGKVVRSTPGDTGDGPVARIYAELVDRLGPVDKWEDVERIKVQVGSYSGAYVAAIRRFSDRGVHWFLILAFDQQTTSKDIERLMYTIGITLASFTMLTTYATLVVFTFLHNQGSKRIDRLAGNEGHSKREREREKERDWERHSDADERPDRAASLAILCRLLLPKVRR